MERRSTTAARRLPLMIVLGAGALFVLRRVIAALAVQLGAAGLVALAALPLCRRLERRVPPCAAAVLSLLLLAAGMALLLIMVCPPLLRQMRQLVETAPELIGRCRQLWQSAALWLADRGIAVAPVQEELFGQITSGAGKLLTGAADALRKAVGGLTRVLLAPLLAFYLLRDRRQLCAALTLVLPVHYRVRGVRAAREMRREASAFMRGQLLLSLLVGALTAAGLLLTGTPGWLPLGLLMGVMELVPYAGPVIAGIPAVLLALQNGWLHALWTLGVLLTVQQLESAILSPRLLAGATQLHPMAVLLLIPAGGILAGPVGMVAILPAVVALRGAWHGWKI